MFERFGRLFQNEHQYAQENLSAYLDKELEAGESARVERHLEQCATCRADLATLRQTMELLRLVPEAPLPRSFLIPAAEARPQPALRRAPAFSLLRSASAIATALFVVVLSGNLLLSRGFGAPLGMGGATDQTYGLKAAPMAAPIAEEVVQESTPEQAAPTKEAVLVAERQIVPPASKSPEVMTKSAPAEAAPGASMTPAVVIVEKPAKSLAIEQATASATATLPARESLPITATMTPPPLSTPTSTPLMEAAGQARDVATSLPPANVQPRRAESGEIMALQQARSRQLVREILNAAMWVLLLATVALWTATAILSQRRR